MSLQVRRTDCILWFEVIKVYAAQPKRILLSIEVVPAELNGLAKIDVFLQNLDSSVTACVYGH